MKHLNAIAFSVPMFYREDDAVDFAALERYLEAIVSNPGVGCLYSMAFNTRYMQLSREEIIDVNRLVCEVGQKKGVPVIIGHPLGLTEAALKRYCEEVADLGAAAMSVLYPERFFGQFEPVLSYLRAPAAAGMSTLIHEMKMVSGFDGSLKDWPMELIDEAMTLPGVVGIKEDSKNDEITRAILSKFRSTSNVIVAGGGKQRAMKLHAEVGIDAWLNGSLMLGSRPAEAIYKAIINGDAAVCDEYLGAIEKPYFEKVVAPLGWHVAHKLALEVAGYGSRRERLPMPVATDEQVREAEPVMRGVLEAMARY